MSQTEPKTKMQKVKSALATIFIVYGAFSLVSTIIGVLMLRSFLLPLVDSDHNKSAEIDKKAMSFYVRLENQPDRLTLKEVLPKSEFDRVIKSKEKAHKDVREAFTVSTLFLDPGKMVSTLMTLGYATVEATDMMMTMAKYEKARLTREIAAKSEANR